MGNGIYKQRSRCAHCFSVDQAREAVYIYIYIQIYTHIAPFLYLPKHKKLWIHTNNYYPCWMLFLPFTLLIHRIPFFSYKEAAAHHPFICLSAYFPCTMVISRPCLFHLGPADISSLFSFPSPGCFLNSHLKTPLPTLLALPLQDKGWELINIAK